MYIRLIGFINENGLFYKYQFGFQKGKSTGMALVTLIELPKLWAKENALLVLSRHFQGF